MTYTTCITCIDYMERRKAVLLPAFVMHKAETGETSQQILDRYMGGVHDRHLTGFSLDVSA